MPKPSPAAEILPAAAAKSLQSLGADLAIARKRRAEPLRAWALRMGVSVPTLTRMERGDPAVGMGVYVTALWLVGRHNALAELAAPQQDDAALAQEVAKAKARQRRSKAPHA